MDPLTAEAQLVCAALSHPAGFNLDFGGVILIRTTDQDTIEVEWEDPGLPPASKRLKHQSFLSARMAEAARFFVEKRRELRFGLDCEAEDAQNARPAIATAVAVPPVASAAGVVAEPAAGRGETQVASGPTPASPLIRDTGALPSLDDVLKRAWEGVEQLCRERGEDPAVLVARAGEVVNAWRAHGNGVDGELAADEVVSKPCKHCRAVGFVCDITAGGCSCTSCVHNRRKCPDCSSRTIPMRPPRSPADVFRNPPSFSDNAPDAKCVTVGDGSCVAPQGCMHDDVMAWVKVRSAFAPPGFEPAFREIAVMSRRSGLEWVASHIRACLHVNAKHPLKDVLDRVQKLIESEN